MTRFTEDTLRLHHRIAMNEKDAKMERQTLFFVLILVIALLAVLLWMFHARNQKAKMQRRLLDMRLSVLRNRISPHFTFNVLNNEMATVPDDRQQQLSALAKLIRENLDLSLCDLISLKQELDFIGTYLGIVEQSVGKIDYRLVTDASLDVETTMIPPMLIQILVENAVKHGFKGLDAPHLLSIELKKDRQSIETTVTNNGNAFDIRSEATGNGLKIIRTVVNLLNQQRGHSATFSIENKAGETVAKLRLPLMKSET
jgi:LytS/YehU family sensor histidine kinase